MPTYCYYCEECNEHFEAFHSMKIIENVCKVCGAEECLTRVPSMPTYLKKNNAGNIVKNHIEEARDQLTKDKQDAIKEFE